MGRKTNANVPIKSVENVFRILQTLQEYNGGGITEIAECLDISKSTAYNHLATLERHGYVVRRNDEYRLGIRFLDHGGFALTQNSWFATVAPRIREIAEETGELCQFAIEEHGRGILTFREKGKRAVETELRLGSRLYLHHFTGGKAILAAMPEHRVEEIVERHGLPGKTDETVTDYDKLLEDLTKIREKGYAFDQGEHISGLHAIGVPIKLRNDGMIGSLSIAGPSHRISEEREEEIANLLLGVVNEMELNMSLQT